VETVEQIAMTLIWIIRAGVTLRVVYCFICMMKDEEQKESYIKRMKHVVIFYIMAECIWILRDLVISYYM